MALVRKANPEIQAAARQAAKKLETLGGGHVPADFVVKLTGELENGAASKKLLKQAEQLYSDLAKQSLGMPGNSHSFESRVEVAVAAIAAGDLAKAIGEVVDSQGPWRTALSQIQQFAAKWAPIGRSKAAPKGTSVPGDA